MPIPHGFPHELNPSYHVRGPTRTDIVDETIYYKREEPVPRPVEVVTRPVIQETTFMPERRPPPIVSTREIYTVAPEPVSTVFATRTAHMAVKPSFSLIPALGLNADCPCWTWICIVLGLLFLVGLVALCLYCLLERHGRF